MNIAIIFAGGVGKRMKTNGIPKQFLEINNIPIIIHTLNIFEKSEKIDAIIVACVSSHIGELEKLIKKFDISKVKKIVEGGKTGQLSIVNALNAANTVSKNDNTIVLIHDGVRPIIDENLINENICNVKKYGSSISCINQKETTIISKSGVEVEDITVRSETFIARAPQSFYLKDILKAQEAAIKNDDCDCIDSCTVMRKYGEYKNPHMTLCNTDNIKITTPDDYYIAKAIIDMRKNKSVLGVGYNE